jgi:hypothetical protein
MPRINETKLVTDMLWKSYEVRIEPRNVFLGLYTVLGIIHRCLIVLFCEAV